MDYCSSGKMLRAQDMRKAELERPQFAIEKTIPSANLLTLHEKREELGRVW
jgi:hypothetical protein